MGLCKKMDKMVEILPGQLVDQLRGKAPCAPKQPTAWAGPAPRKGPPAHRCRQSRTPVPDGPPPPRARKCSKWSAAVSAVGCSPRKWTHRFSPTKPPLPTMARNSCIGEVPGVGTEGAAVGVAGQHRRSLQPQHVPGPLVAEVGQTSIPSPSCPHRRTKSRPRWVSPSPLRQEPHRALAIVPGEIDPPHAPGLDLLQPSLVTVPAAPLPPVREQQFSQPRRVLPLWPHTAAPPGRRCVRKRSSAGTLALSAKRANTCPRCSSGREPASNPDGPGFSHNAPALRRRQRLRVSQWASK